jgi:hypothetical protein
MAARALDLLPVEYFHVVFTLPAEIAQIAYWNKCSGQLGKTDRRQLSGDRIVVGVATPRVLAGPGGNIR